MLPHDNPPRSRRLDTSGEAFLHNQDPYEEHDFGVFEIDGHKLFFKIDYYDKSRSFHSPDPSDPSVTERVITIMLADEY
jgi:Protein of unknown function (DUF3768)